MTVRSAVLGQQITDGNGLNMDGVELLNRMAAAIRDQHVLTSPDGTKYRLVVDNAGNLSTVAV